MKISRRELLRQLAPLGIGLSQLPNLGCRMRGTTRTSGPKSHARVWMTYVNFVNGLDEDFRDMKAHGIEGIEVDMYPSIWVGDKMDPANALKSARKYGLQLAFTTENITLRADRIAAHGITPTPCVMIGGAYQGKAIDWNRFSFAPGKHEIKIEKPVFGSDWTLGEGPYYAELLPPHRAEVIVKEADYDGQQHLAIRPATIEPDGENTYRMRFDLSGAHGDLDNVMLAVYWRMRGPIYEQPQPANYFGNTASPHAPGTAKGLRASLKTHIAQWKQANGGKFPDDIVMGVRIGDEDFLQTVPNGPANPAQTMPLWDFSDDAIAAFKRLNPDDEYPRHWTYREAFGERAYADWMWSLHRACAGLLRTAKETLREEGLGYLKIYRNLTRCNSFYVGNDHGGMSLEMAGRELDIVSADPYPADDRGYHHHSIPGDMGYVAGIARRYGKELMPWFQGHNGRHPSPEHLDEIYRQHLEFEPTRIIYLGYGTLESPPRGTIATFPGGNAESWELSTRLNTRFQKRTQGKVKAHVAAVRDYHVWSLDAFGQDQCLDRLFTELLGEASVRHGTLYDPIEVRSLNELDWTELERYGVVLVGLPREVPKNAWSRFAKLPGKCVLLAADCETLADDSKATGVQSTSEIVRGGEVTAGEGSPRVRSWYGRHVEVGSDVETLATLGGKTCIWRTGSLVFVGSRIDRGDVRALLELLGGRGGCPELIGG